MSANNFPHRSVTIPRLDPSLDSGSARFHQAVDLLTNWFGLSPQRAEDLLLTWSCEIKTSACEVATALMCDITEGRPTGCRTEVLRHLEQRLRELSNESASAAYLRQHSQ